MRVLKKSIWKYVFSINENNIDEVKGWCNETIGQNHKNWFQYTNNKVNYFAFTSEESAVMFKLKWSKI